MIENLTLGQLSEISKLFKSNEQPPYCSGPWKIGECYLIRTVTMIVIGRMTFVGDKELVLAQASWIADTGRFHDALKKGTLKEVEPFVGDAIVGRGSIVDATTWQHALPTEQK